MSQEIANCVCGAEAHLDRDGPKGGFIWRVVCSNPSCWVGPQCATGSEAISAWARLMNPTYREQQAFREGQERTQRECRDILKSSKSKDEALNKLSQPLIKMEVEG